MHMENIQRMLKVMKLSSVIGLLVTNSENKENLWKSL